MFDLKERLKNLPEKPGVYIMKNNVEQTIYIGKAKNLKNRVPSYFQKSTQHNDKTLNLIANIKSFEYIVTDTELEALVLECNLIKLHKPKYNIALKDGKEYPFIKITMYEDFPRVTIVRKHKKDKGKYFGPYTSGLDLKETVELIHNIWQIRDCRRVLPRDIDKQRPCLNAHIKKCLVPCSSKGISKEAYNVLIEEVSDFLNGNHKDILEALNKKMMNHSHKLEFEKAVEYREKIKLIHRLNSKQKVESNPGDMQDIIGLARAFDEGLVQVFFIRGGKMTGREQYPLSGVASMTREEIMTEFVTQYYSETTFIPKEIVLERDINDKEIILKWLKNIKEQNVSIIVPQKGEKLRLVKLAGNNAIIAMEQFGEQMKREKQKTEGALKEIAEATGIKSTFNRIEAYDISNTGGYQSVGSMVVFENGKPKRSDYRKFKIKEIVGADDYGSIEEVLTRRFERYKKEVELSKKDAFSKENKFIKLPDVIFIDGGKGQVTSVQKVLEKMDINIPVCGMVKDDKHKTKGLLYNNKEIKMPLSKEGFKLVTRIQDEVHRFAIEYHKKLRAKSQVRSIMDDINGIGEVRRKELMRHFKDINKIKNASIEELLEVESIDKKSATAVYEFFRK
jgi:excinuclease ABC subunit C